MKKKKKLLTLSTFFNLSKENYKIIDKLSFESKNIYNHSIFCINFYNKFKDTVYKNVYFKYFSFDNIIKNKYKTDFINKHINNEFNNYYDFYSNNYKIIKNNNDIIYNYIKKQNPLILNTNFNDKLKEYMNTCLKLKGIQFNKNNYHLVFYDVIKNILISYYKKNYFHLKFSIINKKPFNEKLNIESFKNHVLKENLFIDNDETKISKYYQNISKLSKISSEQNIIRNITLESLKFNYLYKETIRSIIEKCYLGYKSFISLKYNGYKSNKPKYKDKNDRYIIPINVNSFKIINDEIRICLGKYVSKNYNEVCETNYKIHKEQKISNKYINKKGEIFDGSFMYIKLNKKLENKNIKLIEIIPLYNGYKYKINYVYEENEINEDIKKDEYISIDLGIINLMTIYDPNDKQYIIKGNKLTSLNKYFNKKIDERKCIIKKTNNKETCKYIRSMLIKRENILNNYFNNIVKKLHNMYKNKEKIIIGYNEGWKTKSNMGANMNRKFYEIPFCKLLTKMRNKFNNRVIEVNEAYTSKTDSLNLDKIGKSDENKNRRIMRGLYSSKKNKLLNADLNGAINIMRRYYINTERDFGTVRGRNIYNPIRTC